MPTDRELIQQYKSVWDTQQGGDVSSPRVKTISPDKIHGVEPRVVGVEIFPGITIDPEHSAFQEKTPTATVGSVAKESARSMAKSTFQLVPSMSGAYIREFGENMSRKPKLPDPKLIKDWWNYAKDFVQKEILPNAKAMAKPGVGMDIVRGLWGLAKMQQVLSDPNMPEMPTDPVSLPIRNMLYDIAKKTKIDESIASFGKSLVDDAKVEADVILGESRSDTAWEKFGEMIGGAVPSIAASTAILAATKNPQLAGAVIGLMEKAGAYNALVDEIGHEKAAPASTAIGLINAVIENAGASSILKTSAKTGWLPRAIIRMRENAAEEALQGFVEKSISQIAGADRFAGDSLREKALNALKDMGTEYLVGGLVGMPMSVIHARNDQKLRNLGLADEQIEDLHDYLSTMSSNEIFNLIKSKEFQKMTSAAVKMKVAEFISPQSRFMDALSAEYGFDLRPIIDGKVNQLSEEDIVKFSEQVKADRQAKIDEVAEILGDFTEYQDLPLDERKKIAESKMNVWEDELPELYQVMMLDNLLEVADEQMSNMDAKEYRDLVTEMRQKWIDPNSGREKILERAMTKPKIHREIQRRGGKLPEDIRAEQMRRAEARQRIEEEIVRRGGKLPEDIEAEQMRKAETKEKIADEIERRRGGKTAGRDGKQTKMSLEGTADYVVEPVVPVGTKEPGGQVSASLEGTAPDRPGPDVVPAGTKKKVEKIKIPPRPKKPKKLPTWRQLVRSMGRLNDSVGDLASLIKERLPQSIRKKNGREIDDMVLLINDRYGTDITENDLLAFLEDDAPLPPEMLPPGEYEAFLESHGPDLQQVKAMVEEQEAAEAAEREARAQTGIEHLPLSPQEQIEALRRTEEPIAPEPPPVVDKQALPLDPVEVSEEDAGIDSERYSRIFTRAREHIEAEYQEANQPYTKLTLDNSAKNAVDFAVADFNDAVRVVFGLSELPSGMTYNDVAYAVAEIFREDGDFDSYNQIARIMSKTSTRFGQEIASLRGKFSALDPMTWIRAVEDMRKGVGRDRRNRVKRVQREVDKASDFIDGFIDKNLNSSDIFDEWAC